MRTARNVAIILLLGLVVAFVPHGGNVADAILTALTMGLLAGISWMIYTLSRENQLTLATLSDGRRAIFYGAFGVPQGDSARLQRARRYSVSRLASHRSSAW